MKRIFNFPWVFASMAVCLSASFLPSVSFAAPGWTIEYVQRTGGSIGGFGEYGEVAALWNEYDKSGPITGNNIDIGGETYNLANYSSLAGQPVVNTGSGNGNYGGNIALGTYGPATANYTMRARGTLTFPCGGTYTIAVGSDDGRHLELGGDATILGFGGQSNGSGDTQLSRPNVVIFPNGTGVERSYLQFSVPPGGVVPITAWFWEGGGGDSFEVSIGTGAVAWNGGTFPLLGDDPFNDGCVLLDDTPVPPVFTPSPNPGWAIEAYNIIGGGGATDGALDNLDEAIRIWDYLDANSCTFNAGVTEAIDGQIYNVENHHFNVPASSIDYEGGGDFIRNVPASSIGTGIGANNYSLRGTIDTCIPVGTWTIAAASDDGRQIRIPGVVFTSVSNQTDPGGVGTDTIRRNGGTGHDRTVGTFTITPAMAGPNGCYETPIEVYMYQGGGGHSFEVSIAPGNFTSAGNSANGFSDQDFRLLEDGLYCWNVSQNLNLREAAAGSTSYSVVCGFDPGQITDCEPVTLTYEVTNDSDQSWPGLWLQTSLCGLIQPVASSGALSDGMQPGEIWFFECEYTPPGQVLCESSLTDVVELAYLDIAGTVPCIDPGVPVAPAPADVIANVPEAADFSLAYTLDMAAGNDNYNANGVPYSTDNSALLAACPYSRVAYYYELADGSWVYTSMDAFNSSVAELGLPNTQNNPVLFQQIVNNMNVFASAGAPVTTGTGIATGNIEFWPSNYGPGNTIGIPGANNGLFDFGDGGGSPTAAGYGSFQVHNHGAAETIFAYNGWGSGSADTGGIGTNPGAQPDWTFQNNDPVGLIHVLILPDPNKCPVPGGIIEICSPHTNEIVVARDPDTLAGCMYLDLDYDGTYDECAEPNYTGGATLSAYDCDNMLVAETTVSEAGCFTISLPPAADLRLELTGLADGFAPAFSGPDSPMDTFFLSGTNTCGFKIGVVDKEQVPCFEPVLAVTCFAHQNAGAGVDTLVLTDYRNAGSLPAGSASYPVGSVAVNGVTGAIGGLAYQESSGQLFSADAIKNGTLQNSTGGIYVTSPGGVTTPFVDITTLGITTAPAYPASLCEQYEYAFTNAFKAGIGDIEIANDSLWLINMFDQTLVELPIGPAGTAPTAANVFPIPNPGCSNGEWRPAALGEQNGTLYVGGICSGENGGTAADLLSYVYEFDPLTGAFGAAPVAVIPIDYSRPLGLSTTFGATPATFPCQDWNPWIDRFQPYTITAGFSGAADDQNICRPTPVLTDIQFDDFGYMSVAYADRFTYQAIAFGQNFEIGNGCTQPEPAGEPDPQIFAGGDVLRLAPLGNGFDLESAGSVGCFVADHMGDPFNVGGSNPEGPDGGEFFDDDFVSAVLYGGSTQYGHTEIGLGYLAHVAGLSDIAMAAYDPLDEFVNEGDEGIYLGAQGVRFMDLMQGFDSRGLILLNGAAQQTSSGKATGIGDIEAWCGARSNLVEVGNFLWFDCDKDGIQDPCDTVVEGAVVELWEGGLMIAMTTTDMDGRYSFSSLTSPLMTNTAYEIRIPLSGVLDCYGPTVTDYAGNAANTDAHDSDAVISSDLSYVVIAFETGDAGCNDYTLDAGFVWGCPPLVDCPEEGPFDLGCLYNPLVAPLLVPPVDLVPTSCGPFEVVSELTTVQTNCGYTMTRIIEVINPCAVDPANDRLTCTQTFLYTVDLEPPKVVCTLGRALGCVPDGVAPSNYVAEVAPVCLDLTNVVVTDSCDDCNFCIVGCEDPLPTTLGNPLVDGSPDGWMANMVIDKDDIFTNTTGAPLVLTITNFAFFVQPNAQNPVTPFLTTILGGVLQNVVAIGDTVTVFTPGAINNVPFSSNPTTITLAPGESIVPGFTDAFADGSGGLMNSTIPYTGGGPVCYTGGPSGANGQLVLGSPIVPGSQELVLNRDYAFMIGYEFPKKGTIELWCDTYYTNDCVVTLDRKIRVEDCCGNVNFCTITYTMNDTPPAITNLPTGMYVGCQSVDWRPPTNTADFGFSCPYTNAMSCGTNITESTTTNATSCLVTLTRTYSVTGCCGVVVSEDVVWTFTMLPDLVVGPLAKLDIGCIASTNQIPPVDLTMLAASSSCAIVSIQKVDPQIICIDENFDSGPSTLNNGNAAAVLSVTTDPAASGRGNVQCVDMSGPGIFGEVRPLAGNKSLLPYVKAPATGTACMTVDYFVPAGSGIGPEDRFLLVYRWNDGNLADDFFPLEVSLPFSAAPGTWATLTHNVPVPATEMDGDPVCAVLPFISFADFAPAVAAGTGPDVYFDNFRVTIKADDPVFEAEGGCTNSVLRTFEIETLCGVNKLVSQEVCYILNNTRPEILATAKNAEDFGCVDTEPRTLADSLAALVITNATVTTLVSEVRMNMGCEVMVTRTWRVEDCCGNFDRREETYMYTPGSGMLATATVNPTVDVGCVTSLDLIPASPQFTLRSTGNIYCYKENNRYFTNRILTRSDQDPASFTSPDGGFSFQMIRMNDDGGFLLRDQPVGPEMNTALFSQPVCFSAEVGNLNCDAICISPPPDAIQLGTDHIVSNGVGEVCIYGTNCADTATATVVFFTNATVVKVTGIDGTSDFRINTDFAYTTEVTEFVDGDGNLVYLDGNGDDVTLPADAELCRQGCDIDVSFVTTQASMQVFGGCTSGFERVYQVAANCSTSTVTQTVLYVLDTEPPRIVAVSNYVDYGCVPSDPRSLEMSTNGLVTTDDNTCLSTQMVMQVAVNNGCDWTVTRSWRVEDSCGNFDLKDEVYSFTITPTALVFTVAAPPTLDLGCITSTNQVPPAVPSLLKAEAPIAFCPVTSIFFFEAEDATVRSGVNNASVHAGFTGTGYADFGGSGTFVEFTVPGGATGGPANITFRYAVGNNGPRSADVVVNGTTQGVAVFALTPGGWTDWTDETVAVTLSPGPNTIRIVAQGNGPNLDSLAIDLSCIDPVDLACDTAIHWVGDTVKSNILCQTFIERVYLATNDCGLSAMSTQCISYILNETPSILGVPPSENFGCIAAAPCLPDPWAGVVLENAIISNVTAVITENPDCSITMVRTYGAVNCCGVSASTTATYTWTPATPAPTIVGPALVDLGCILDVGNIPVPSVSQFQTVLTNDLYCATDFEDGKIPADWTIVDGNPGDANDPDFQVVMDAAGNNILLQANADLATGGGTSIGGYALLPKTFCSFTACFDFCLNDQSMAFEDAVFVFGDNGAGGNYHVVFSDSTGAMDIYENNGIGGGRTIRVNNFTGGAGGFDLDDDLCYSTCISFDDTVRDVIISIEEVGNPANAFSGTFPLNDTTYGPGQIGFGSYNDAPSFDNIEITGSSDCSGAPQPVPCGADVAFVSSSATNALDDCLFEFTNTYEAAGGCSPTGTFEQTIRYTLSLPPEIVSVEKGSNLGCRVAGYVPPTNLAAIVATNAISTNVSDVIMQVACETMIMRTYRVENCCNRFDERVETYTYTPIPDLPSVEPLMDLDLGCIASTNQIPPVDLTMAAVSAECGVVSIRKISTSAPFLVDDCTMAINRCFEVTAACGITYPLPTTNLIQVSEDFDTDPGWATTDNSAGGNNPVFVVAGGVLSQTTANPDLGAGSNGHFIPSGFALPPDQFCNLSGCFEFRLDGTGGDQDVTIAFNYQDPMNFYYLLFSNSGGRVDLYSVINGTINNVMATGLDGLVHSLGTFHEVCIDYNALSGALSVTSPSAGISHTNPSFNPGGWTSGQIGFGSLNDDFSIDNVNITGSTDCAFTLDQLMDPTAIGYCQRITYTLETVPQIISVPKGTNFGCQAATFRIPPCFTNTVGGAIEGLSLADGCIDDITVGRGVLGPITYSAGQLIGVDLTCYQAGGGSEILVPDGVAPPPPGSRATLIEDLCLDTGILNPTTTVGTGLCFTFASAVCNAHGPDLVFFELDPLAGTRDPIVVTINGVSVTYGGADYNFVTAPLMVDTHDLAGNPNLGGLETLGTTPGNLALNNQAAHGLAIDLDDFGITGGSCIMTMDIAAGDAGERLDPLFIAGLPSEYQDAPVFTNALGIDCSDWYVTNGCDVAVTRVFIATNCCGNFDRREVDYSYTLQPGPATVDALAHLDLGCINGTNNIPAPSAAIISAMSTCSVTAISWCGDTPAGDTFPAQLEGEDMTLGGAWAVFDEPVASGGQYIEVPNSNPGSGDFNGALNSADCASGTIKVFTPGLYRIVARVRTPAGTDDSFYVRVDGDPSSGFRWFAGTSAAFSTRVVTDSGGGNPQAEVLLGCGDHLIEVCMREDGSQLDWIGLELVQARPVGPCDCPEAIVRCYDVTDVCGEVITVNQCITYIEDSAPPRLTVPGYAFFDCVTADPCPAPDFSQVSAIDDNGVVSTQMMMEVRQVQECNVLVTRTWRVEDCCGNFDIKDQVYGYSIMPTNFANVAAIADLELGCISDAAQVPAPSPLFFSADAFGAIGVVPTQTVLSADADAYVRGRSESQNSNFGTGGALQIKYNLEGNGRGDRFNRKAYIRYDISPVASLGKLTNAVLCLPLVTGGGTLEPGQTYTFAVYGLNDGDPGEGWAEGGITWNNAPQNAPHAGQMAAGMTLLGRFTVFETGVGSTINFSDPRVLQFVQGDSDGQVTFAVVRETQAIIGGAYTHAIQSKEGGDGAQLKLGSAVSADLPINCPVGITWAGDAVVETTPCTTTVERVYIATNDCGLAVMTTQTIRYTIDRVPEILMVEKGTNLGCVPANFYPGTNFGAGVWLATNAVSTNVMDMVMTIGCEVMLRRSYVIRNCCGEFDRREEVYTWTVRPDVTTLDALASLDLGCIASTNQIPTPTSLISEMDSACGGGQVVWLGDQLITGDVCPPEIEAEAMALSGNFVLGFDPVASGGSYIEGAGVGSGSFSAPNANTAEAGFTVLTPGTYQLRVWLRTPNNGPNPDANGNNDSFFYAVDGILGPGPWNRTTSTVAFPSRVVAGTWDLTCGEHTVTLFQREDGTEIDRVALELVTATPEPLCECPDAIVRTYQMTDLCGGQTTVQQCFTYTLDTAPPRIDAVSNYVDYACVTTEPRPLADSLAAVIGSDIDGNLLSTNLVQEVRLTNGCFVTVTRSWRVEDCCGNFDLRDETYSYTDTPAITAMPMIQDLNLGCIATTNSIPPPSALLLGGNFACGANITFQDRFLGTDGFCTWTNQRVFSAMDECGGMLSFTQLFTYTLDTGNPLITAVPAFTNYGCVAGDPRPLPMIDQVAAVDDGNIILTQLVMEMRSVIGHEIEVTRTWRVEDCCGNWHEKDSVYRFTPSPTNITVATLPDLNLGCLDDMAQIPQPDPDIVDATVFPRPITNCSFVLIKAGKDSYVWNDQAPGPNLNGSQPWIQVGDITSMLGDSGLKGYLQFDLSGAPFNPLTALSGACLEFSVNSVNPNASGYPACFEVLALPEGDPGEAWTEALLEWANAPFNDTASNNQFLPGLSYVADFVITNTTSNTTVQLCGTNLANVLTANLDGIVTLLIRGKDPVSAPILIGSRENMGMPGVTPPTLRIDSCVETPIVDVPYDVVWTNDMIVSTSPNGCTTTVERVYVATEECGLSASVTQTITYLENGSSPEITWVEIGIDWGCQPSGWTPPTNLTASLMATNAISTNISDKISVTNCTASVQRTFRVENCCGDFDTRVVTHTYTITPDGPGVDALADLDLGCIPNASLVPQPSTILVAASSSCAVVSILWTGDTALSNAGCVSSLERGYLATDLCGQTNAIVQTIQWIENDTDPAITVPAGIDFGCSGLALPAEWDGVTATNFITSNVVTSTDASDPCLTTVTRTYSVADCCGDSASASVVYTFIPSAPAPTLAGPELIDLGCIADLGQIPVPSTSQFSGSSTCGAVIAYVGSSTTNTTVCSHEFIRTYRITDQCGGTNDLLQTIRYSIDTDDPKFLVLPGGDLGCAPVTLPSAADDILAMTVTDACSQTTMFVNESSNLVDCTWTLVRNYMAIDDCDNSAVAQVTYTWTLRPPAPTLDPLAELDVGCVGSPAAVPGPSLALLSANTTCSETLSWRQDLPADLLPGQACIWSFERVYQVEDGCGEIATTTQTVTYTLESTVQITAVPPPQDFGCVTVAPPIPSAITTTGNVQNTTIADTLTTNDCRVTLVREWTSTGCCGEFDQASQTFNWTETPGVPSLIGPLQIDLGCIADEGQIPQPSTSQFTPVAGCGARVRFVAETPVNVIDNCNRALNRTYEITDSCGQTNQVVQSITWTLNDIPVEITATESGGHLGCLALAPLTAPTTLPPELTSVVVVGNPTGLFVNVTLTNDGCLATLTREYTTRDCCGNFDRATVVWTWDIEQAPPVITGPALIALGCIPAAGQVPVPSTSQFTVQSACGSSIALLSESTPSTAACVTSLERVYQASGNCGESATFTQTVTWVFENPPNLTAPAGQTFGCESADPAPSLDWTTVTLGGGLVVSSNAFENTTIDGCTATKVLTYNVIGCCGGQVSDSVTYTWTVQPAPPTLAGPERIDLGCLADVGQIPVPNPAAFTVASDCSASTAFVVETPLPADGCTNLLERVYTATDNCGQSTTLTQTITWVTDGGAPVITSAPPGGDLGCAPVTVPAPDPNAIVAQDGCRVASIIHLADITNRVGCVINLRRVYRVTDLCNNRTDLDVRYHWTDDAEAPTLTPPAGFQAVNFLGCNPNIGIGNIPPVDLSGWSATDNCGSVIPRFFGDEITTNGCAVRVERVFHAIDTCGNTTTATQTYRYVLDNAQPTPTLTPGDLDLGCDITGPGDIPAPDATIWSADDMCGPIIATNHIGDTTTSIGCETFVTRTFEFTDDCGNTGQASQVLRYRADNAAPTILCPPDEELGCNPQSVPAPNAALAFVSDDCGQPTVIHLGDTATTNGCAVEILRVFQAIDSCGKTSTCTQRISFVQDSDAPTHNAPADAELGCNPTDIPAANFVATDACSLSTNVTETTATSGCLVTLTRTWNVADACGNTTEHIQTLTWTENNEAPTLLAPPALELGCNPASIPAPNPAQVQATDDCGLGPVTHVSDTETDDGCARMILRVFEATDNCGNSAVVTQAITWSVSTESPTLTDAPVGQTLACNAAVPAPNPSAIAAQAGCGNATAVLAAVITNQTACMLTVVHEYLIADACGNQVTHQVNWGIPQDSEAPTINCPANVSLTADALCEARVDDLLTGAFSDNCGIVESTQQPPVGTVLGLGNHTITLTALDTCGNATTCTVPVTVMGGCTPGIDIQKTVASGHGADCSTAIESLSHTNGAPITWCLRVENTGTVPLEDVTVRDLPINYQNTIPGVMQPGDVVLLSVDATLTIDLVNTASVTGEPLNGAPQVSDADPAEVHPVSASIALLKTVAIGENAQCPAVELIDRQQGDMVTYCFEVTNTGEIPLTDVVVVDPMLSATPIPVVGSLLPGQTAVIGVPDMFEGAPITNVAYAAGSADSLPDTASGGAPILATPLDPAIVMPPCGCAGGTVFNDLANDGSSVGDNLANLGIPGVTVELYADGSVAPIATMVSDVDGRYSFAPLMSGTYTVRYDETTLPADFTGMPERTVTLGPCDCIDDLDLAAVPSPTAVRLESFKVHPTENGLLFSWTTGSEIDTLGFRVLGADGAAVTPRLVLAGAGQYALHVPGLRAGSYTLEEVTNDLANESLATVQVIDAAPQGPPTETVEAVEGLAQFETVKDVTSYLVIGFANPPTATTASGDVLAGALLEVDGDHAIYFSPRPGLQLTVE